MTDQTQEQHAQRFRHNPEEYPSPDDLVICQVTSATEVGIYVSLLEYGGMEGLISMTDWTARHTYGRGGRGGRGVIDGQVVVARVTRVDPVKGFIDLSRRSLPIVDAEKAKERWNKTRAVRSLLVHLLRRIGRGMDGLEEAQREWIWPLYASHGHPYDACRMELSSPIEWGMPEDIQKTWKEVLRDRLTRVRTKVRCEMDLRCYGPEGVEAIQNVLRRALAFANERGAKYGENSIRLIASPYYAITLTCETVEMGMELMDSLQRMIRAGMEEKGGSAAVRVPAFVVGGVQEEELQRRLEELQAEQKEEEEAEWD